MQEQQLADASGEDSAAEDAPGVTEEETVETGGEDAVVETVDVAVVVVVATGTRGVGPRYQTRPLGESRENQDPRGHLPVLTDREGISDCGGVLGHNSG